MYPLPLKRYVAPSMSRFSPRAYDPLSRSYHQPTESIFHDGFGAGAGVGVGAGSGFGVGSAVGSAVGSGVGAGSAVGSATGASVLTPTGSPSWLDATGTA